MTDPLFHRKFILNSLEGNNNKIWEIAWFPDNSVTTTWGRVGSTTQSKTKPMSRHSAETLIDAKVREGYKELELHSPVVVVNEATDKPIDPKIVRLVDLIMREAGDRINSYLSVTVDALSVNQINRGRGILQKIVTSNPTPQDQLALVKEFYNTIPTKLPSRIDPDEIVRQ